MNNEENNLSDKYIHVIVDGEVTGSIVAPGLAGQSSQEMMIAAFMSNPTFVVSEERHQRGSIWDGQKFVPPVE